MFITLVKWLGFPKKKKENQPQMKERMLRLWPLEHSFETGDRVKVRPTAGFHKGAHGSVTRVEVGGYQQMYPDMPAYDLIWVERDGAGSSVWYLAHELSHDPIDENIDRRRAVSPAQPWQPSI